MPSSRGFRASAGARYSTRSRHTFRSRSPRSIRTTRPAVGWFAGVVLLWISDAWNTRDKLIGTLVLPGGFAIPFFLLAFVSWRDGLGGGGGCFGGPNGTTCTSSGTAVWPIVRIVLLVLLLVAPLVADAYLLWRLRRRTRTV